MKTRAITGLFFIVAMLASVLINQNVFYFFYLILNLLCLWEFYGLFKQSDFKVQVFAGLCLGGLFFLYVHPLIFGHKIGLFFLLLPYIVFIQQLFQKNYKHPFGNIALTLIGIVYITLPFICFYKMAFLRQQFEFYLPLGFLLLLWSSDTGAYLFGVKFGKHRLFERHSPKKSWEGFLGGLFSSLLVSIILNHFFPQLSLLHWLVMALLIVVFGTLGDLVESMLKRSLTIKDSGNILPGHGGVLDRFDGLLIAAPVVYLYLHFALSV